MLNVISKLKRSNNNSLNRKKRINITNLLMYIKQKAQSFPSNKLLIDIIPILYFIIVLYLYLRRWGLLKPIKRGGLGR